MLELLSGEGKVVQAGDPKHRVMDSVSFQPTVAKDLPGLHAGKDVLDAGADPFVGPVASR
ncbi:hypothetical protein [Streptomyces lydicus]